MIRSTSSMLLALVVATLMVSPATGATIEKLYVIGQEQGIYAEPQLLIYSLERDRVLRRLPLEIGADAAYLNADGSELWVLSSATGGCDIVNTTSDEVVGRIEFGARIDILAFTPDGQTCYAAGPSLRQPSGATVQQYNCVDRRLITSHELPAQVSDMTISSDSRYLYYTDAGAQLVGRVRLSGFERQGRQYVGFGPQQLLKLKSEGWLLAVCSGLGNGALGGGQVTLLDAAELTPLWVFDGLGAGPTSMALSNDQSTAVLTFTTEGSTLDYNVAQFESDLFSESKKLRVEQDWLFDGAVDAGVISASGKIWLGVNRNTKRPLVIDLAAGKQRTPAPALADFRTEALRLLALDLDERIANLPAAVTATDSAGVAAQLLAKAYLHFCAGDANTVIVECQDVIDKYPGSRAAVVAGLLLAQVAEANNLPSKAAEETEQALLVYCDLLETDDFADPLPGAELSKALDRLARFDRQFDKESVKRVAERFLDLDDPGRGSARFFYNLGRQLRAQDDNKMADRCFDGARLALVHEPESVRQVLATQLTLALRDKSVVYEIKDDGKKITLDGDLSDWEKVKPLVLKGPDNLSYGRLNWLDSADLSATIFVTRSEESILIGGTISDADLVRINAEQRDKVGIHFDLRNSAADYTTRDHTVGSGCFSAILFAPTNDTPKASVRLSAAASYQIASEQVAGGWLFELSLPLTWFGSYLPDERRDFGFGIEIVDYDSPNAGAAVSALGFLQPRSAPGAVVQPQLYGVGRFK